MKRIPKKFWEVVKARYERMPENLKLVIGGYGSLSKKEILEHLERKDEVGKFLVRMQLEFFKVLREEAESYEKAFNNKA
ncbi:MAG: hypothetical protein DRP00_06075 [Candidatus Aenigmatarchaeota archaeon]|nr:MAG: hypothetical protein DRP00_06075 [Candidatus Aenigmarchaeota archaeon]